MSKGKSPNRWSEDEVNRLMSLYHQYGTKRYGAWSKIVEQMPGRTELQCQQKVRYQIHGRKYRERYANYRAANGSDAHYVAPTVAIPPRVIADAERRRFMSRPTITAEFFGDPLPGYSALDRRQ